MPALAAISPPSPRSAPVCSTIPARSIRRANSSRVGAPHPARRCATTFPRWRSTRQSRAAVCASIGRDVLALAKRGLRRRARLDAQGRDESVFLAPLEAILEDGRTLAQQRLDAYNGGWGRSIDDAFTSCVLPL